MTLGEETYLKDSQIHEIESWEEFQEIVDDPRYRRWAFRGQGRSEWPLYTSLSRYLTDFKIHKGSWPHQEDRIMRIFRRKAPVFLNHIPEKHNIFEWLALMQHHGAPTRLLDFTWSPYVAAFFALEKANSDCAVWAIDFSNLRKREYSFPSEQILIKAPRPNIRDDHLDPVNSDYRKHYWRFFLYNSVPFVVPGEPYNINQRQIAQSGTFLVSGILDKPIEGILSDYPDPEKAIVKFVLKSKKLRDKAMESLYYMNITNATLFPGIDGMARALAYELEFHWAFNLKTLEGYEEYLENLSA